MNRMEPGKLKNKLLHIYEGKKLEDIEGAEEVQTDRGQVLTIKSKQELKFKVNKPENVWENLSSNLKLIKGIGEYTEEKLKKQGFKTIEDLKKHPLYSPEAVALMKIMDSCNSKRITKRICLGLPRSHPLVLRTSCFNDVEDFLFLDIETLGLRNQPIILIGEAKIIDKQINVSQYLSRNLKEEQAVLASFTSNMEEDNVFVTFNGVNFDIPFIKDRLTYYHMSKNLNKHHLDLLHFSRRLWGRRLPNCRLNTLERYLFGMERQDDVPSALVPEFYWTYHKEDNIGPLIPIIEHNRLDIITLTKILSRLYIEMDQWDSI